VISYLLGREVELTSGPDERRTAIGELPWGDREREIERSIVKLRRSRE